MFFSLLSLVLLGGNGDDPPQLTGVIRGTVVNSSRGNEPLGDAAVVLRAGPDDFLEPVAETRTDLYGKFAFEDVPLDRTIVYLPGADRDGVHYPGERVRLSLAKRFAHVTIVVFEAVASPSPLVARQHDIVVNIKADVMEISETLLIANPERATYVGEAAGDNQPVTLRLSIPPNFDRVTFSNEFYGRRFWIADHQPVTDIPWPPGERELKFTYRVPLTDSKGVFRRVLDTPSANVRVRVPGKTAQQVSCNLPLATDNYTADANFVSGGEPLPAGHEIELKTGTVPFPWTQYARWGSLAMLAALTLATVAVLRRAS